MIKRVIEKIKFSFFSCQKNNYQPYILRSNFLFSIVLAFFILRLAVLPFYAYFSKSTFFAKIVASELISLLNQERQITGLSPLQEDSILKQAALLKAQDMLKQDYFGHQSPQGVSGWFFIEEAGYDYYMAGENLAIGFLDSDEVHKAWNNSPSHKANLLNPNFEEIGIAVLKGDFEGNETTVVVQLFGKPRQVPIMVFGKQETEDLSQEPDLIEEIIASSELETTEQESLQEESVLAEENTSLTVLPEQKKPDKIAAIPAIEIDSFQYNFWRFLAVNYNKIVEKTIFALTFIMSLLLMLNLLVIVFSSTSLTKKLVLVNRIAMPALLTIILLISLGFFDKLLILQLIPHQLAI